MSMRKRKKVQILSREELMLRRWDFRLVPSERSLEAVGESVRLHIISRSKVFDLFPRTYRGNNRCVLRQKHALINSREETIVLLSKGMVDNRKVKVDFSLEDMDLSEFKGKATYEQIKVYVLEQTGLKVSNLYIAQIKKKCGLDVGESFNLPKSENAKQPKCTPEKEEAIMQAFKHFGII